MTDALAKDLWYAAQRIRSWLLNYSVQCMPEFPEGHLKECDRGWRQLRMADQRGWHLAANSISQRLAWDTQRLLDAMRIFAVDLDRRAHSRVPSTLELYEDLCSLSDEFVEVRVDSNGGALSAITDEIVLDGVALGCFEIRLEWNSTVHCQPYRILALQPNPPGCNDSVTHPHVQNEQLCEGDGRVAIRSAFQQGRMADFFLVIKQILCTYSRGNAYVELHHWNGVPCSDCGSTVDDDDRYYCEECEQTVCSDCVSSCDHCDAFFCSSCTTQCEVCGGASCRSCLVSCLNCQRQACPNCHEEKVCAKCSEEQEDEVPDDSEATIETQTAAGSKAAAV